MNKKIIESLPFDVDGNEEQNDYYFYSDMGYEFVDNKYLVVNSINDISLEDLLRAHPSAELKPLEESIQREAEMSYKPDRDESCIQIGKYVVRAIYGEPEEKSSKIKPIIYVPHDCL